MAFIPGVFLPSPLLSPSEREAAREYFDATNIQFHDAVKDVNIEEIKKAIENNATVNQLNPSGYTALMVLTDEGSYEGVKLLLKRGARTSVVSKLEGFNALMVAADSFVKTKVADDIFALLLASDSSWSVINGVLSVNELTPLMIAVNAGRFDIAKQLKVVQADINRTNSMGRSALTYAAEKKDLRAINFLLDEGFKLKMSHVLDAINICKEKAPDISLKLQAALDENPMNFINDISAKYIASDSLDDESLEQMEEYLNYGRWIDKNFGLTLEMSAVTQGNKKIRDISKPLSEPDTEDDMGGESDFELDIEAKHIQKKNKMLVMPRDNNGLVQLGSIANLSPTQVAVDTDSMADSDMMGLKRPLKKPMA